MLINIQDVDGETKEPCVVKKELIKDNCDVALKSLYRMHLWFICIICMFAIKVYTFVLCMKYFCVACRHAQQQFEICIHPRSLEVFKAAGSLWAVDDIDAAIVMKFTSTPEAGIACPLTCRHLHQWRVFCKVAGTDRDQPAAADRALAHSQACTLKGIALWQHYMRCVDAMCFVADQRIQASVLAYI